MNVLILYFSGTGNSSFIANQLGLALQQQSDQVQVSSVENFQPSEVGNVDLLIFGFPVYACDLPRFLWSYLDQIEPVDQKGLILYSTMGFYGGNALRKVADVFSKKGFTLLHQEEIKMPGSDGLVFMKKDSKYVQNLLTTDFREASQVKLAVAKIVEQVNLANVRGIERLPKQRPRLKLGGSLITGIMKLVFGPLENSLKQKFWVDEHCIRCGLCARHCPAKNISIEKDQVKFLDHCYLCMRCINQCPAEAIQIGKRTQGKFRYKGPLGNDHPKS